jgi:hypothetical protein
MLVTKVQSFCPAKIEAGLNATMPNIASPKKVVETHTITKTITLMRINLFVVLANNFSLRNIL